VCRRFISYYGFQKGNIMTAIPQPQDIDLLTELCGRVQELESARLDLPDVRRVNRRNLPAAFRATTACALALQSVTETLAKFNGRRDIGQTSNDAIIAALTLGYEIKDLLEIVCTALERSCQ